MPKRGVIASLLTAAGLVLLLSFKTPTETGVPPRGNGAVSRVLPPAATPTPGGPQAGPDNEGGDAGEGDAGGAVTPTTPSPTAAPNPPSGSGGSRTITGPVVTTRYGDVQLQLTLSNGRISDVTPLRLPNDLERSAYISSVAGPILRDEVLQAQSAQIDLLSGATYTSEAYAESIQAVLDHARG